MANEITVLPGDGGINQVLLFIYTILPKTIGGNVQVVTPSVDLPNSISQVVSVAEKTELDNGTMAFEVVTMQVDDAKTNAQLIAQAQTLYNVREISFLANHNRRYKFAGARLNRVVA